jgi:hypothetical protein
MRISFAPLDADASRFLSERTRIDFTTTDFDTPSWFCVTGRHDGHVIGVAVFEFKLWFDAHMSCAIADRRVMSRRLLKAMFTAVFSQATRITALIEPFNTAALRQARIMGFLVEGHMVNAVEGNRDAVLLGMTRETCRYLREPRPSLSALDGADRLLADAELSRSGSLRPIRAPDRQHLSGG